MTHIFIIFKTRPSVARAAGVAEEVIKKTLIQRHGLPRFTHRIVWIISPIRMQADVWYIERSKLWKLGRNKMCQIMENRINEEKIDLAKKAIARGKLTLDQIAETLSLPLAFVQELAKASIAKV